MPPTTPPTMAPTGVELSPPPLSDVLVVLVGRARLVLVLVVLLELGDDETISVGDGDGDDDLASEDDAVTEKLGGVARSVARPPVAWHWRMEKTWPGEVDVE